jgi:hypothetical protein
MPKVEQGLSLIGSIALIVIGLLIFVPSGLCTGIGVIATLVQVVQHPSNGIYAFGSLPLILASGLPFVVGGAVLIYKGVSRIRDRNGSSD